ncbi:MAG: SxtJ family membrane protein [Nitrosomonas sp.]|nr:SxtJ family membrane protein [Nitrosomonas sp.]
MLVIDNQITRTELRSFGLVTAGMLVLFFGLLIPWIWGFAWPTWPFSVAGILVIMALAVPASLRPVYKVWMHFASILGWVNTRIILGLIFFLMFLPLGLIMRLFNDPMRRNLDKSIETYRVPSSSPKRENMEKLF